MNALKSIRTVLKTLLPLALFLMIQNLNAFTLLSNVPGWSGKELTVYLNKNNCTVDPEDAVKEAVKLWNSVSTAKLKLKIVVDSTRSLAGFTGFSYANVGGILCDTTFSTTTSTLGVGTYAYSSGDSFGYVRLNASGGTGDLSKFSGAERAAIIAHEIGHMVNIGHTDSSDALMYYQISTKSDLSLSWDDLQAYTYLYPRNEIGEDGFMACGSLKSSNGSGGSFGFVLALLAPLLLASILKRNELKISITN